MSWNVGESGTDVVRGIYKGGMLEDIVGVYFWIMKSWGTWQD